jgi:Ca-activated chloride channel homolog
MEGERLRSLKTAMNNLTGDDRSLTGQFARFSSREKVTVITFSGTVNQERSFEIVGPVEKSSAIADLKTMVAGLSVQGGTAIYSALQRAYQLAGIDQKSEPDRYYSIVLMTDGENNQGIPPDQFFTYYRGLPRETASIRMFPILFGEGNKGEMQKLAEASEGRLFDGQKSLAGAFKSIRGYQ